MESYIAFMNYKANTKKASFLHTVVYRLNTISIKIPADPKIYLKI